MVHCTLGDSPRNILSPVTYLAMSKQMWDKSCSSPSKPLHESHQCHHEQHRRHSTSQEALRIDPVGIQRRRNLVLLVALLAGPLLLQHADVYERLVHLGRNLQGGEPVEALEAVLTPVLAQVALAVVFDVRFEFDGDALEECAWAGVREEGDAVAAGL